MCWIFLRRLSAAVGRQETEDSLRCRDGLSARMTRVRHYRVRERSNWEGQPWVLHTNAGSACVDTGRPCRGGTLRSGAATFSGRFFLDYLLPEWHWACVGRCAGAPAGPSQLHTPWWLVPESSLMLFADHDGNCVARAGLCRGLACGRPLAAAGGVVLSASKRFIL